MNIKQQAFDEVWDHLPIELKSKCSSCSETTVHIVMKSMADLGITENMASGFLAEKLGKSQRTIINRVKRGKKDDSNESTPKLPKSLKKSEDDNDSHVESVSKEEIEKIQDELADTQKRLAKELAKEKKRKEAQAATARERAKEKKEQEKEQEEKERQAAQLKRQRMENSGIMPVSKAFEVFGIKGGFRDQMTEETAKILYKGLAKLRHPDLGGSNEEIRLLNTAYNTIKLKGIWRK